MKWGSKTKNGDTRILKKYAWFPIRIRSKWGNPEVEWCWLEQVKIRQEYNTNNFHDDVNLIKDIKVFLFGGYWKNEYFIEFDLDEKRDNKLKKLGI
jgi:hypothetical protein